MNKGIGMSVRMSVRLQASRGDFYRDINAASVPLTEWFWATVGGSPHHATGSIPNRVKLNQVKLILDTLPLGTVCVRVSAES